MNLKNELQLADGQTLTDIEQNIQLLTQDLTRIGRKLLDKTDRFFELKCELIEWTEQQEEDIRSKEKDGYLLLKSGEKIKLTDAIRASLARCGKKKEFAEYEALKREQSRLESATKALSSALTGQQTLAKILTIELENL